MTCRREFFGADCPSMAGQICLPRGHPGIAMNIYSTEKNMNRDIFGCPISRPVSNVKTIKKIEKKTMVAMVSYGWFIHIHSAGHVHRRISADVHLKGQEDPRAASHRNLFNKRKAVPHIVQQDLPFCGCELIHLRPRQAEILLTVGRLGMCKTDIYTYPMTHHNPSMYNDLH